MSKRLHRTSHKGVWQNVELTVVKVVHISNMFTHCLRPVQLQHLVSDDICVQATELFLKECANHATGGYVGTAHQRMAAEASYQKQAEQLMSDENCFRVQLVSTALHHPQVPWNAMLSGT